MTEYIFFLFRSYHVEQESLSLICTHSSPQGSTTLPSATQIFVMHPKSSTAQKTTAKPVLLFT